MQIITWVSERRRTNVDVFAIIILSSPTLCVLCVFVLSLLQRIMRTRTCTQQRRVQPPPSRVSAHKAHITIFSFSISWQNGWLAGWLWWLVLRLPNVAFPNMFWCIYIRVHRLLCCAGKLFRCCCYYYNFPFFFSKPPNSPFFCQLAGSFILPRTKHSHTHTERYPSSSTSLSTHINCIVLRGLTLACFCALTTNGCCHAI